VHGSPIESKLSHSHPLTNHSESNFLNHLKQSPSPSQYIKKIKIKENTKKKVREKDITFFRSCWKKGRKVRKIALLQMLEITGMKNPWILAKRIEEMIVGSKMGSQMIWKREMMSKKREDFARSKIRVRKLERAGIRSFLPFTCFKNLNQGPRSREIESHNQMVGKTSKTKRHSRTVAHGFWLPRCVFYTLGARGK
jgi:hypothetical protein